MRVVRWLAAYRPLPLRDHVCLGHAEAIGYGRERAAEPLHRGRSLVLAENGRARVGLAFSPADVVRAFARDVWSEPVGDRLVADPIEFDGVAARRLGRTSAKGRRGFRDWDRFARFWASARPTRHGEVWLRDRAEPIAVCYRAGDVEAAEWAAEMAAELGLPVIPVRPKGAE